MNAPEMRKAAAGRQAASLKTSNDTAKNTAPHGIRQRAKGLIVGAALGGLLPILAADLIIRRLHLGDA